MLMDWCRGGQSLSLSNDTTDVRWEAAGWKSAMSCLNQQRSYVAVNTLFA